VNAPTLWEEGRWSGSRVTRFSVFACFVLVVVDLAVTPGLGPLFDAGFVLLCLTLALAVRPEDFFHVGVLPPLLLLGWSCVLAVVDRGAIAPRGDGLVQATISGLAHHSGALLAGYASALVVLAIRHRVLERHEALPDLDQPYSNLAGSPAPTRVTSAAPEVKSTTVVGSEPDSPSMTASST
jgi:hypothetical protein